MTLKTKRFELIEEKEKLKRSIRKSFFGIGDMVATMNVIKDTKTGVCYALASDDRGMSMTVLVDRDGKPFVDE